jgi:regulator of sirC expression with transglutaminase-like and TPR domain
VTREEAEHTLVEAGATGDADFPLLEAAIACAIHDYPLRNPAPVRLLASQAAERLSERVGSEEPDEALTETLASDFRLTGDLLTYDDPGNTNIIDVAERRRGLSATLAVFYLHAARLAGIRAQGVDFPNHFMLRVDTSNGPVALDPFSEGRVVMPSELTRRALRAGLTPHVADRLDPSSECAVQPGDQGCRLQRCRTVRAQTGLARPGRSQTLARRCLCAREAGCSDGCARGPVAGADRRGAG